MPWVRLDDGFPRNRKILALSDAAFRLHVSAICWCSDQLTDGMIRESELRNVSSLTPKRVRRALPELVEAGLWEPAPGGWVIHDYLDYNSSRAQVAAERERAAKRQAAWRDRQRNAVSNGVTEEAPEAPRSLGRRRAGAQRAPDGHPDGARTEETENASSQVRGHVDDPRNAVTHGVSNGYHIPYLRERTSLSGTDAAGPAPAEDPGDEALVAWIGERHRPSGRKIENPRGYLRTVDANGDRRALIALREADLAMTDFAVAALEAAGPGPITDAGIPEWCGKCGLSDGWKEEQIRRRAKFRTVGLAHCPACHPDHVPVRTCTHPKCTPDPPGDPT